MRQNIADDDDDVDDDDGKGSEGRIKQAQDERCLASCREIKTMWAASLKSVNVKFFVCVHKLYTSYEISLKGDACNNQYDDIIIFCFGEQLH